MDLDENRLCIELKRLDWAHELNDEIIRDIAAAGDVVQYETGQVVIELDTDINHVYFIIAGELAGTLYDRLGKSLHSDVFRRGSVAGMFSLLLVDRSHVHVEAVVPTTVMQLGLDDLLRLAARHREFQLAMFRVAANIVKHLVVIDRELPKPAVVGVVHHSDASRAITTQLAGRLLELGESPCMAGDDERWKPPAGVPHRLLYENRVFIDQEHVKGLLKEWASYGRLFLDFRSDHSLDDLNRLLAYSDAVLWCLRPPDIAAALESIKAATRAMPNLREKLCLVWILDQQTPAPPYDSELFALAARDFKVCLGPLKPTQGKLLGQGIERIVHYLRGVQIGLALGGGAARGMAHLGVLKALEEHGIFVDMLAGTSAGAMVSGVYAAGHDPDYLTECFKTELLPHWIFRQLPAGGYWYLLYKYRRRQFGPMLRKYVDDLRIEQLLVPVTMISVDLVEGVPLVRDRGDTTDNMLESINLPPLSLPIVGADQAVVDGGLLNNVPASALVAKGCNFVIASTVTAQLEKDFMGIRSQKTHRFGKLTSSIQVILRQAMIQSYSMNAVGVAPADFVIAPDVTAFDISQFTRADEMAVIGKHTTNETVHKLKAMLGKLDSALFA
jgi:predicted acylesterase/phospholipase RssA/CRP-like cAMP-binding protein